MFGGSARGAATLAGETSCGPFDEQFRRVGVTVEWHDISATAHPSTEWAWILQDCLGRLVVTGPVRYDFALAEFVGPCGSGAVYLPPLAWAPITAPAVPKRLWVDPGTVNDG